MFYLWMASQDGPMLQAAPNPASFFTQVKVLTIRSFKNMYRDLGYYWLRLGIYVALCICIGTVYYKVGTSYNAIQVCISTYWYLVRLNLSWKNPHSSYVCILYCSGSRIFYRVCVYFLNFHGNWRFPCFCGRY